MKKTQSSGAGERLGQQGSVSKTVSNPQDKISASSGGIGLICGGFVIIWPRIKRLTGPSPTSGARFSTENDSSSEARTDSAQIPAESESQNVRFPKDEGIKRSR